MLQVVDQLIDDFSLIGEIKEICDAQDRIKIKDNQSQYNWYCKVDGEVFQKTLHAHKQKEVSARYFDNYLIPQLNGLVNEPFEIEWWCNKNNYLNWHIDKDESEYKLSRKFIMPIISTVYYPFVDCCDGELLIASHDPIRQGYQGRFPSFETKISIPPVRNRLVSFSSGLLHRIMPFIGSRYSFAANIWPKGFARY